MFTPAGEKSRAARVTRKPRLGVVDQPAVPIAGPPSYSYGSPGTNVAVRSRRGSAGSVSSSFQVPITRLDRRTGRLPGLQEGEDDEDEDDKSSQFSSSSRRTPRLKAPSMDDIEASINRRRSLRSGSKTRGRLSPSDSSLQDLTELKAEQGELSLDYDVTQSSVSRTYDDTEALLDQLDQPTKETHYGDETSYEDETTRFIDDEQEESVSDSRLASFTNFFNITWFMLRRIIKRLCHRVAGIAHEVWTRLVTLPGMGKAALIGIPLAMITLLVVPGLLHFRLPGLDLQGGKAYVPPTNLPETSQELVARLWDLEQSLAKQSSFNLKLQEALASVDKTAHEESKRVDSTRHDTLLVRAELAKLADNMNSLGTKLTNVAHLQEDSENKLKGFGKGMVKIEIELAEHKRVLEQFMKSGIQTQDEMKDLRTQLSKHNHELQNLERRVDTLIDVETVKELFLTELARNLPAQLAVAFNQKSGRFSTAPEFWRHLKSTFVTRDDASAGSGGTSNHSSSWSSFLIENEDSMQSFVQAQIDDHWRKAGDEGVVVSKAYFLDVLRSELSLITKDIDDRLSAVTHSTLEIGNSVKEAMAHQGTPVSKVLRSDESASQFAVEQLINAAIHKYSMDVLARPDFAAYTSGSRINPFLTSPTYMHRPVALIPRLVSRLLFDIGTSKSHPPAMAIHPSNAVGMCWAFPGQKGQLSVKLSHPVLLTDVAIEHVHPDIAHDPTSAPRDVEIWAHMDDASLDAFEKSTAKLKSREQGVLRTTPADGFVHIMDITYQLYNDEQAVQVFPVSRAIRSLNIPVDQVLYRVKSNWGNDKFTCLYRVRAIGLRKDVDEFGQQEPDMDQDEDIPL